jgi:hypothetical protein
MQNADFPESGERFLASQFAVTPREHIETNITRFSHGNVDVVFKRLLLIVGMPG